jgi:CheY-like chemotaxis protein
LLLAARPDWEINLAASGAAALQLLQTQMHDVVVTDLQMPALDGIALLRRLKSEQLPVMRVIHSSHIELLGQVELDELSHAVIAKPARPDQLIMVLEWALAQGQRRLRDSVGY